MKSTTYLVKENNYDGTDIFIAVEEPLEGKYAHIASEGGGKRSEDLI
jgi:hypothetical protein